MRKVSMERQVQLGMWTDPKQNEEGSSRVGQPDIEWKIGSEYRKQLHREVAWIGKSDPLQEKGGIQGLRVAQSGE